MGKCGGRELNYATDVDVIFVAAPAGGASEDAALRAATQLAAATISVCSQPAAEGPLFPVDANLRPEGRDGPLVRTLASHRAYYERWAKTWEFQALLKARPVAGDAELGKQYIAAVMPMVWTACEREDFVAEVQFGTGAVASLSPSSLNFGNEPVDVTSTPQVVTLNNTGSAALSITSIAFTGANATDFTQNDTCGASVAAGGNCTIAISFAPLASGARGGSLTITDNASGSPQSVSLAGTGTHDVTLSWTDSTTPGIVGYNIYRGTTSGGESSTPLNSTPINGTTYTDENVTAGAKYYYVVTAVASNGTTQSGNSNEVSATVPSP